MSNAYHDLGASDFTQDWTATSQISTNDDWSGVASIIGYLGDISSSSTTNVDPRTLTGADLGAVDVIANQNSTTISNGGVAEFEITNPAVALQGSGTADAPSLVLFLDATGRENVRVQFNAIDLDGSGDDAAQQINVQYRIGESGDWTNVDGGYAADVTTANASGQTTAFDVTLPAAANGEAQIQVRIMTTNAGGSDEWVGIDDISVSSAAAGASGTGVSIANAAVTEGDAGTKVLEFTVTRTDNTGDFTVDYATADDSAAAGGDYVAASGTLTFVAGGDLTKTVSVTINGDADVETDETFTVELSNLQETSGTASITDGSATGTITNDDFVITNISAIQGAGDASDLDGQTVTVEAIVVGDFQNGDADDSRNLNGFYLQEEAGDWDLDALTSEGIFVFGGGTDVQIGDRVRVTGTVDEYFGQTQLNASAVTVVEAGAVADVNTMAQEITLPAADVTVNQDGDYQPDLEAYEGMLVRFSDALTITEQFNLDRFNEIKLVQGDRPAQFVQDNAPDQAGYQAHLEEVGSRTITYDDGLNVQNAAVENLDGFAGYDTATAPRMGDTITDLTGVLDYQWAGNSSSGSTWRVRAVEDGANEFVTTTPREAEPADVGGTLSVCSLNVLNYFATLDDGSLIANGNEPRGANTSAEFDRQTEKLVTVLQTIDADLFSLVELENDFLAGSPGNSLEYLCDQLNAALGADIYDWVDPGMQFVGGDAIAPGFLYKTTTLALSVGTTVETLSDADLAGLGLDGLLTTSTVGSLFDAANTSRYSLAATFTELSTGGEFTAIANHLKSKSGTGTGADADQLDGQGNWQQQRELAAEALAAWAASKPTGTTDDDILLAGDFNAYFKEDAIGVLETAGFDNLQATLTLDAYSYVFDGQTGSLDYIFANDTLGAQITGLTEWHINSDEADAIDYNLDYSRDPGYFDGTVPVRVSDHDPLLIGINLYEYETPTGGDDEIIANADDNAIDGGDGDDTIDGGDGNDTLTGGAGDDMLSGGEGDDVFMVSATLPVRDGRDTYDGGDGIDTLDCSSWTTRVHISLGDGKQGIDKIIGVENAVGGSAKDTLRGSSDANSLVGNDGDDLLVGFDGDDKLDGGLGNDRLDGREGNDTLDGGDGDDRFYGAQGDDTMEGGAGEDLMIGGAGNDVMNGGADADRIEGRGGDDVIDGGAGADLLIGGAGVDGFLFTDFDSIDIVADFQTGRTVKDAILLDSSAFTDFGGTTIQDLFDDGYLNVVEDGGSTLLQADLDGGGDGFATFASLTGAYEAEILMAQMQLTDMMVA
ncbi:ExeM/NucH family extracellular endonuclease [Zavarzinia compransoris]|uniref:ExeM/NucH family extracellular endonuclease n=1 Tax=Zavarzinia marina TaxID=2911065 RepID=UPI001F2FEE6B|nr:ExeM/NucH family extracellular endonuclease [Zavarzinia marina]MCF4164167.1 ExeM/NucH family extracellular endonuclease [Zavarzinia marina]